mgnify:CR=1 FL=1
MPSGITFLTCCLEFCKSCKDYVQTYWDDYKGGGEGNLQDTEFADLRNKVQACANKWYPKWPGLSGGVLGINDGDNKLSATELERRKIM